MPVTKSAKKALKTATRRHAENLIHRDLFKKAVKAVRKGAAEGSANVASLFSEAQSTLDKAAKRNTIHPNKAARLKSRLAKRIAAGADAPTAAKTKAKSATKKKAAPRAAKKSA